MGMLVSCRVVGLRSKVKVLHYATSKVMLLNGHAEKEDLSEKGKTAIKVGDT